MVACLADTCTALQDQGLAVAKKSVIVCTRHDDARYIANAMRRKGFPIRANTQASYLGIDL
eukprot:9263876-Pyramimonas_sp.AAC.1